MKIPSLVIMDTINIDHENIKILNIPKSQKISLFVWFIRLCSPSIVHIGAFLMSAGPYKYILLKTWGLTYLPRQGYAPMMNPLLLFFASAKPLTNFITSTTMNY